MYFRKPGAYRNRRRYPQGGRKRRIGRGVRQIQGLTREVSKLKSFVNTEFKRWDNYQAFVNIPDANTSPPVQMLLNDIAEGVDVTQRTGQSVRVKSIQHRCTIDNTTTSSLPCRVRMIFFLDLRPDGQGNAPPFSQLLDISNSDCMTAMRNLDYRSNYSILSDRTFKLDTSAPNHMVIYNYYKRVNFHTVWKGLDSSNAGLLITKNGLWCYVFSDQPGAVLPRIKCDTRIRYIDN